MMPVAAPTIGSNDKFFCLPIALLAHAEPPTPDGLHSKCRCVMVSVHAPPGLVSANVINPIRIGTSEFLVDEAVDLDLDWLAARQPLLTRILAGTRQFLLLRVHRNHGLIGLQGRSHRGVDMLELGVAIRALIAFAGLGLRSWNVAKPFSAILTAKMASSPCIACISSYTLRSIC